MYLVGSERTEMRVVKDTNYSCLMQKTQRFHSLFRHYAKYHGLRKDELEYEFVSALGDNDTPESVQLQRADVIHVRKRREEPPASGEADDDEFRRDMSVLRADEEHMDCVFRVEVPAAERALRGGRPEELFSPGQLRRRTRPEEIRAHKAVLTARGEYF
ncbi:hypothetical protein TeGR_g9929, partial [Tetraparma gracilis]